jgi:hypothetical protein
VGRGAVLAEDVIIVIGVCGGRGGARGLDGGWMRGGGLGRGEASRRCRRLDEAGFGLGDGGTAVERS